MAPIRVKWDPEILAAGFRPSSIFDGLEADNTTASTTTAPVIPSVGDQDVAVMASPAKNISTGLATLVEEMARRVADLATNLTSIPVPSTTTTTTIPSWSPTTTTIIRRAVETASQRPEIAAESVSIFFIFIVNCQNVFFYGVSRPKVNN